MTRNEIMLVIFGLAIALIVIIELILVVEKIGLII